MVEFLMSQAAEGKHSIVEAPTGIGKTAAAMYAMARDALAAGAQTFYVTPKNTQHAKSVIA